ncbi:nucleoside hydrolase [Olivibacter sp. SA151]|uniref:nucleoside hydrolase n=1 Tax=Olivibacter jilunii TaxID=985016 RepID=UPI003F135FCC
MKKAIYMFAAWVMLSSMQMQAQERTSKIPKLIFDTDMGPDYDDVGAIAILHHLAAKGECEILATVASDSHVSIAPTIELFNRYFKRPDIPVGMATADAPAIEAGNHWNDSLIKRFDPSLQGKRYPSAIEVYRKVLAGQQDHSVTIVTVGFLSNLNALLQSKPDQFSPLNGVELVKQKVKKLVAMAGGFPQGAEFNVMKDASASYEVFRHWPSPILFSGFEIGKELFTGGRVAQESTEENPVAWAYAYNLRTYAKEGEKSRPSWDQTAVLCAIRNPEDYFYVNGPGQFVVDEKGNNVWNPNGKAEHYFLSHKYPYNEMAKKIEDLMMPLVSH